MHVLDVCVDYVGRDGVRDMKEVDQALQRRAHQADDARQHRSAGDRGRAEAVQRQDDHQLDQPRRRPQDARPEDDPRQEVRGRARRADHRRKGPGRHRRVEVRGRQAHLRHRRERIRHSADATCCSIRSCSRSPPARSRRARAPSPRSRRSSSSSRNCPGPSRTSGLSNCSLRPEPVHAAGAQQRLPALRPGIRPRFGDPARGQDHAAVEHRRDGQGTLPPAPVRRTHVRRGRELHRRPAANADRALRGQEGRVEEGPVARRDRRGATEAGDHPGPARDR